MKQKKIILYDDRKKLWLWRWLGPNIRVSSGPTWEGVYNSSDQKKTPKKTHNQNNKKRNFMRIKTNY